jgi:hypothetical protein
MFPLPTGTNTPDKTLLLSYLQKAFEKVFKLLKFLSLRDEELVILEQREIHGRENFLKVTITGEQTVAKYFKYL